MSGDLHRPRAAPPPIYILFLITGKMSCTWINNNEEIILRVENQMNLTAIFGTVQATATSRKPVDESRISTFAFTYYNLFCFILFSTRYHTLY